METKKGFLELLFLTDEQEYTIDRYWERGGIFVLLLFILSVLPYSSKAQMSSDSLVQKIAGYIDAIQNFGDVLPQEKVYLHFDNTSYYQGDPIWFQCYVVTPGLNHPTELSKTLYVELLNPGGEIISKRVLPIRNGRCHSSFELTQLPFYSGFYEVRAYTKYMSSISADDESSSLILGRRLFSHAFFLFLINLLIRVNIKRKIYKSMRFTSIRRPERKQ